jgi:uncharacterized repeat protein (TIGR01451 family)
MKKSVILIGAGILTVSAFLPVNGAPAIAQVLNAGSQVAQNMLRQPKIDLHLSAERQVIQKDASGKTVMTWAAVNNQVQAKPGDILRFTVVGKNEGNREAQSFSITQPVPSGTKLVANSVNNSAAATVVYSIDQGKTFVAQPMVKVTLSDGTVTEKPAPIEAYTHARWSFSQALPPMANVNASYQVAVR